MEKSKLGVGQVFKAAVQLFLLDGEDHTATEIAEHLGCSVAAVRRVITAASGCPYGLRCDEVQRESFSRSYKGAPAGYHKVWVYGPDRASLRKIIRGEVCQDCGAPLMSAGCGAGCSAGVGR